MSVLPYLIVGRANETLQVVRSTVVRIDAV